MPTLQKCHETSKQQVNGLAQGLDIKDGPKWCSYDYFLNFMIAS